MREKLSVTPKVFVAHVFRKVLEFLTDRACEGEFFAAVGNTTFTRP
jgi:hypothetical protein